MSKAYNPGAGFTPDPDSQYGIRIDPLNRLKMEFHAGQDFKARPGTPIPAATSGTVVYSGANDNFGNTVIVKNDSGGYSLYAHMQDGSFVQRGQRVWPGETTIGRVGSTGKRVTGPHLHYSLIKDFVEDDSGQPVLDRFGNRIPQPIHQTNQGGSIGIHVNEHTTIDPAKDDPFPYLAESQSAERQMFGDGYLQPPLGYDASTYDPRTYVPRTPPGVDAFTRPFDPEALPADQNQSRTSPPDALTRTEARPFQTPDLVNRPVPFQRNPAGSLRGPERSFDPAPTAPYPGPFGTANRFVQSPQGQQLYPTNSFISSNVPNKSGALELPDSLRNAYAAADDAGPAGPVVADPQSLQQSSNGWPGDGPSDELLARFKANGWRWPDNLPPSNTRDGLLWYRYNPQPRSDVALNGTNDDAATGSGVNAGLDHWDPTRIAAGNDAIRTELASSDEPPRGILGWLAPERVDVAALKGRDLVQSLPFVQPATEGGPQSEPGFWDRLFLQAARPDLFGDDVDKA